jgi:hypothetical protein
LCAICLSYESFIFDSLPSKQIEIIQSNATMYFGVKIKDYIKVILNSCYMFRLQWSRLQTKCLRNKIVSGIPGDLRELVKDFIISICLLGILRDGIHKIKM